MSKELGNAAISYVEIVAKQVQSFAVNHNNVAKSKAVVPNLGIRTPARGRKEDLRGCEMINSRGEKKKYSPVTQISVLFFILCESESVVFEFLVS